MSSKKKILILDDEPEICEILLELITPHFPNSIALSDSQEAKNLLEKETFSLILSDVMMPHLKGPELVRLLRSQGNMTLVVFLTGKMDLEIVLSALRLGVNDVLAKPFDGDSLIETIQRIFEIDKRTKQIILNHANKDLLTLLPQDPVKQNKMLGLLHVVNEKRKTGNYF